MSFIPPIRGTHGDDVLSGTSGADDFALWQGGNDTVSAGDGNDVMRMGAALNAGDQLDGGTGVDTVILRGDYSAGLTFAATTMVNVEILRLLDNYDYNLTTDDATVAAGTVLTVRGDGITGGHSLTFDGSAETDGNFRIVGSAGNDTLTGGALQDNFFLGNGGNDTVHGGGGNDVFFFASALDPSDTIDGGAGYDTVHSDGWFGAGADALTFTSTTMQNVEDFVLDGGSGLEITTADATVAAGATLTIDARSQTTDFFFDGSAETDGHFIVLGGSGNDTLTGGALGDTFRGGMGADLITGNGFGDTFVYRAVAESSGAGAYDTIVGFDAKSDRFSITGHHNVLSVTTANGSIDAANFDTDLHNISNGHLSAHGALVVFVGDGDMVGHTLLVIDGNGDNAYEAGQDYVIDITGYTGTITTSDFI
jgi:Ca2+-binding RTX toxin-like protein